MNEHWQAGYADAAKTLAHDEIFAPPRIEDNPAMYDFLTAPARPATESMPQPAAQPTYQPT
jgi:NTE family protein